MSKIKIPKGWRRLRNSNLIKQWDKYLSEKLRWTTEIRKIKPSKKGKG